MDAAVIALALGASLFWGVGDFLGGMGTRGVSSRLILGWGAGTVAPLMTIGMVLAGVPFSARGLVFGVGAGLCGGLGLYYFYRGMARGRVGVVAPITGSGVIIPVVVGIGQDGLPGPAVVAGMVLALVGTLVLSAATEHDPATPGGARNLASLGDAFIGAVLFGMFFVLAGSSGVEGAPSLWLVAGARWSTAVMMLGATLLVTRDWRQPTGREYAFSMGAAGGDSVANTLFVLAAAGGPLGLASMLASLYPGVAVLLAVIVLRERLGLTRRLASITVLLGIVLMAAPNP